MSPSGATGVWGSIPSTRATSLVFIELIALPSRTTDPPLGLSRRPSARRSVDLPQPLGPMTVVITPVGISRSSPSTMMRSPYPSVRFLATRREGVSVDWAMVVML